MQTDTMPTAPYSLMDADLSWQEDALCAQAGPEFFFPAPGSSTREAKLLCGACEGRVACLEYALAHDERFGVWGGLSEKERIKLKRRQG
ncbi:MULTISPECIES: WhiB family transcriptional regulator [unclassified Streptomyces]|uniref:WhiB family transcriptional regulator n=1 Tax=unclassified Streptomyces TaxID=2593676 RepID=UPI0035E1A722